jgi:uncharacterized membrane protein YtjA (UPF0391 family)
MHLRAAGTPVRSIASMSGLRPRVGGTSGRYEWAVVFSSFALIAALFGFALAAGTAGVAKVLFVAFLLLALISVGPDLPSRRCTPILPSRRCTPIASSALVRAATAVAPSARTRARFIPMSAAKDAERGRAASGRARRPFARTLRACEEESV